MCTYTYLSGYAYTHTHTHTHTVDEQRKEVQRLEASVSEWKEAAEQRRKQLDKVIDESKQRAEADAQEMASLREDLDGKTRLYTLAKQAGM